MRCTKIVFKLRNGKRKKSDYLSASSTYCVNCHSEIAPIIDGKPCWYKKQKPKVGLKCHDEECGAEIVEVEFDKEKKTKKRVFFSGTDNRGNPYRISECFGEQDYGRKGPDCKLPCVMFGGTNVQTSSARSHTIHVPLEHAGQILIALKAAAVSSQSAKG